MPRYKIFTSAANLGGENVEVEQTYPAFTVISASEQSAELLREKFPLQRLPEPPSIQVPPSFQELASANDDRRGRKDWAVSFKYPIKRDWTDLLAKLGVDVIGQDGSSTLVAAIPNKQVLAKLKQVPHVQSVTPHRVKIDVDPSFFDVLQQADNAPTDLALAAEARDSVGKDAVSRRDTAIPGALLAEFYNSEDADKALRRLKRHKVKGVSLAGKTRLAVDLIASENLSEDTLALFQCPGLKRVEQRKIKQLFNDRARNVVGADIVTEFPHNNRLSGLGEIVAVADSGLDTGDAQTVHADFRGRIVDIESWPITPGLSSLVTNPGGDDGASDDFSGHGTHVSGSVLGDGSRSATLDIPPVRGMAPEAQLVFQAIEQRPQWTPQAVMLFLQQGRNPPASGLYGIPDDLTLLFDSAYQKGARIHNNSWGGGTPGAYDAQCEDVDRFVWEQKDFLVVVAAGNSGSDQLPPLGHIDPMSVDSPATAKNCLTVGACENDRPGQFADQYGQWWADDFPNGSLRTDPMIDSIDDVVAFSSRGPCATGRRKPDVIAPGTFVLSTRSSRMPDNNFSWGAFPPAKDDYMYMGGTSMASPLTAGSAALLRQHLRAQHGVASPSAALLKAGIIHSARYLNYRYAAPDSAPFADNEQGWGRVDLASVIDLDGPGNTVFFDDAQGLWTGEQRVFTLKLPQSVPLRVTLVYSDFPGENLVNNLNLLAFDPHGSPHIGNDFDQSGQFDDLNNVEAIFLENAAAGEWELSVVASDVIQGPQDFALVISADGITNFAVS